MSLSGFSIVANYASFAVIGGTGILINIFLLTFYNADVLGRFNFFFACLIVISQLTVGGIQFSVLRHSSICSQKIDEVSSLSISALILSFIYSIVVISLFLLVADMIEALFDLIIWSVSLQFVLLAVIFFSFNKVLVMAMNGLNLMLEFAICNALRFILLFFFVVVFSIHFPPEKITIVFLLAELALFFLLVYLFFLRRVGFSLPKWRWFRRHFSFGMKGLPGGALMEINTRVDVLMIGAILGYSAVGVYSFASMIAEGISQLFTILRNNVDPVFGKSLQVRNKQLILDTISTIRKKYVPFLILVGLLAILLYKPIFLDFFGLDSVLINSSWIVLIILVGFILLVSYLRPFFGLLIIADKPLTFSVVILSGAVLNVVMNSTLIPWLGINGAAISTGFVFAIETSLLYFFAKKTLKRGVMT